MPSYFLPNYFNPGSSSAVPMPTVLPSGLQAPSPLGLQLTPQPLGRFLAPARLLPHVVDIYRNAAVRGDAGDVNPVPVAVYRGVRCWVQMQAEQVVQSNRLELVYTGKVAFYQDPRIANGDFLRWTDPSTNSVRTLVVKAVNDPLNIARSWTVNVTEIR